MTAKIPGFVQPISEGKEELLNSSHPPVLNLLDATCEFVNEGVGECMNVF